MAPRKVSNEEWIKRVETKYPGKYTFEKTKYTATASPVIITCKVHGDLRFNEAKHVLNKQSEPCRYCAGYLPEFEETQEWLRTWMHYEEDTGAFYIRANKQDKGYWAVHGYRTISFSGKEYLVHRLIFLYMMGYLPEEVDHIDSDRSNNKWENLREADRTLQELNKRSDGVERTPEGRYLARIRYLGKTHRSKRVDTYEEAKKMYEHARLHFLKIHQQKLDNDIVSSA